MSWDDLTEVFWSCLIHIISCLKELALCLFADGQKDGWNIHGGQHRFQPG